MYTVPTMDPEQMVILYEAMGLFQIGMAIYQPAEEGKMSFRLTTMDDRDYFSLKLDDQLRIGDLKVYDNEEIRRFNQTVYSLTYREESRDETAKGADAICCRKESSWSDCMNCTIDDCQESWVCKAAAMVLPRQLLAGFAVSCIGSGPDALC